jgi:hypothetical protein
MRSIVKGLLATVGIAVGLLAGGPAAQADGLSGDALFDQAMIMFNVPGSKSHLEADGREVCARLEEGYSFMSASLSVYLAERPMLSPADVGHLSMAAVFAYCPQYEAQAEAEARQAAGS